MMIINLSFEEKNVAAALGFWGAIIGVSIPLYSALSNSISYIDFAIFGSCCYCYSTYFCIYCYKRNGKFSFTEKISQGVIPVGILMVGFINIYWFVNAGSMSY